MATDVKVIAVTRSETRRGDPMWTLQTAGGDRINVFDNMLKRRPWSLSGYPMWFEAMESGQTDCWTNTPILVGVTKRGQFLEVESVQSATLFAQPDKTPALADVWTVYGPYWWHTLSLLSAEDTIVFDTETTGVNPELDEAVSIAVQSFAAPQSPPVAYHSLIAPRFPGKLLERNAKGECAHDIHGIHPDDLVGQPPFPVVHSSLWEILQGKNWVCWNTDFDVALLDSLCLRHGLPLIPRNRVVCAMKLLSPLAGKWDEGRAAYRWAKLEEMASAMQLEFPEAHDAAADVKMTIRVMNWAYSQAQSRMHSW